MTKRTKKPLSANAERLVAVLRELGHTGVKVHWERLGAATEMCGPTGGWFFRSDQQRGQNHLGDSIDIALAVAKWRHRVPQAQARVGSEVIDG